MSNRAVSGPYPDPPNVTPQTLGEMIPHRPTLHELGDRVTTLEAQMEGARTEHIALRDLVDAQHMAIRKLRAEVHELRTQRRDY